MKAQTRKTVKKEITQGHPFGAVESKPNGIPFWSKVKFYVQLRSGFLTVPILFLFYYMAGVLLAYLFGRTTGFYDPAFIQPLFLAGAVVWGSTTLAKLIIYFNYRTLHRYIWGVHKPAEKIIINYSKDDFKQLTNQQRICVSAITVLFYVLLIALVFLKMV